MAVNITISSDDIQALAALAQAEAANLVPVLESQGISEELSRGSE